METFLGLSSVLAFAMAVGGIGAVGLVAGIDDKATAKFFKFTTLCLIYSALAIAGAYSLM